jgi:hypothetical protein
MSTSHSGKVIIEEIYSKLQLRGTHAAEASVESVDAPIVSESRVRRTQDTQEIQDIQDTEDIKETKETSDAPNTPDQHLTVIPDDQNPSVPEKEIVDDAVNTELNRAVDSCSLTALNSTVDDPLFLLARKIVGIEKRYGFRCGPVLLIQLYQRWKESNAQAAEQDHTVEAFLSKLAKVKKPYGSTLQSAYENSKTKPTPLRVRSLCPAIQNLAKLCRELQLLSKDRPFFLGCRDWKSSAILKGIRDYNEDDCKSTAELCGWLRKLANKRQISYAVGKSDLTEAPEPLNSTIADRQALAERLRAQEDPISVVLGDLVDFHRRELKPMWWKMFDRAEATVDELRDDAACIEGLQAHGDCATEKKSLLQKYRFDPSQECKLDAGDTVMFTHNLDATFSISAIDLDAGELTLKIGKKSLDQKCQGAFPRSGSVLRNEYVNPGEIPDALAAVAAQQLSHSLHNPVKSLLGRSAPATPLQKDDETPLDAALRIIESMSGGYLVIQGPPGTGKTYTAACIVHALLAAGKKVGITSNSHKAVVNLLSECGNIARRNGRALTGIKVGDDPIDPLFKANPGLVHVQDTPAARAMYTSGVVGGTAWLFTRPEWRNELDFLFIDEAGQVSLANAVAMSRAAKNIVLLGDQMQLEQPVQGSHPGDAGMSALQYALKDTEKSWRTRLCFTQLCRRTVDCFFMNPAECIQTSASSSPTVSMSTGSARFQNARIKKLSFHRAAAPWLQAGPSTIVSICFSGLAKCSS